MVFLVGLKCSGCGYNCHEKCMSHVPKNCTSNRLKGEAGGSDGTNNASGTESTNSALSPSDGK